MTILYFCQVCILSKFILSSLYFVKGYFVNSYFVTSDFVKYVFVNYVLSTRILSNPEERHLHVARIISSQKIYGLYGLKRHIVEISG